MTKASLMVVGTASSVGKSLLVTAFCRIFKRRGYSVAPFKSQNMSLNSFVTAEGHEMGRAQVSQAEAAGLAPSAQMNPILLKPTTNSRSQVIVNGKVHGNMSAVEYYDYKENLRPAVQAAYEALAAKYDVIVIEGAGSPAEINLMDGDFVNMGMAAMADAPVILAGDIDRGGVFASLYGTVKLLPPEDQTRIKGLLVNKFRGDVKILEPGLRKIEDLLKIPVLGVIPYGKFAIDEEDSLTDRFSRRSGRSSDLKIAVLRLPRISNFTDFAALDSLDGVTVHYVEDPADLDEADMIVLPGSKNTIDDMNHLTETGLSAKIKEMHRKGRVIAGICGGFQMLGRMIHDPYGVEREMPSSVEGLGLLDVETSFARDKHTIQSSLTLKDGSGPLAGTNGMILSGYEIHMGETALGRGTAALGQCGGEPAGAVDDTGRVFGSYLHGFFDNLDFTRRLLDNLGRCRRTEEDDNKAITSYQDLKEREYDRLADMVEEHLPFEYLLRIMNKEPLEVKHG